MQFDIFTLLPEVFPSYLETSILKRAAERGLIEVRVHNIRDYTHDKHHTTDDTPYGGGGGMVMKPAPVFEAIESVLTPQPACPVIMLTPQGRVFDQHVADELSRHERIALICGRYEGIDERIREHLVTDEISIGDYVLSGGEIPAMVVIDAVVRLIPGVLGDIDSAKNESFFDGLLEHPQYTRPAEFRGMKVPDVLMSGHHQKIKEWQKIHAIKKTAENRPDLVNKS